MGMSAAERTAAYRIRQQAKIDALPKVACECGCGTLIPPINKKREPARFAHGHNPDGKGTRFAPGHKLGHVGVEARRAQGTLSGPGSPHWKGGQWKLTSGYVRVTLSAAEAARHPTALCHGGRKTGWSIQRSHLVWNTAHPGDLVQPGEHIHHRNRQRDDDRLDNLQKMTAGEHRAMHAREPRRRRKSAS